MMIDTIYTDGSCIGNPGAGSRGWLAYSDTTLVAKQRGTATYTTNNQMELQAIIASLSFLQQHPQRHHVIVYTDSEYAYKGITQYASRRRVNGWKLNNKQTVKNLALWQQILHLLDQVANIEFRWVKAHAQSIQNNQVDHRARNGII